MAKTRLLVTEAFGEYRPGDRITGSAEIERVLATHSEYVLREKVVADSEPTKAEVKQEGVPPETEARVEVGLPAGPVKADDAKPARRTSHTLKG